MLFKLLKIWETIYYNSRLEASLFGMVVSAKGLDNDTKQSLQCLPYLSGGPPPGGLSPLTHPLATEQNESGKSPHGSAEPGLAKVTPYMQGRGFLSPCTSASTERCRTVHTVVTPPSARQTNLQTALSL